MYAALIINPIHYSGISGNYEGLLESQAGSLEPVTVISQSWYSPLLTEGASLSRELKVPLEEEPAVLRDGSAMLELGEGPSDSVTLLRWADVTACTA